MPSFGLGSDCGQLYRSVEQVHKSNVFGQSYGICATFSNTLMKVKCSRYRPTRIYEKTQEVLLGGMPPV
jgi:hypothetical protein